jgi:RNA polymerase sigma-70 factor (ECF subfamily)
LRDEESAVAWFYRVLRNAVIDHYRRRSSSERAIQSFINESDPPETPGIETRREICECLMDLVGEPKAEYRDALRIVDLDEGSLNDLAARAGITPGNAAVRVHRAREALRKQIEIACGTCAEHGCLDCHCKEGSTAGHCQ